MTYQDRVRVWAVECFGENIADDLTERIHRFTEESLELAQAVGCTKEEVLQLVDYVYSRPKGEIAQEIGGVMTTINTLASVLNLSVEECAEKELENVWNKIDKIRAKQKAKPKFSPLPQ